MGHQPARPCRTAPYSLHLLLVAESLVNFVQAVEPSHFIAHCRPFNLVASSRLRCRGRPNLWASPAQFDDPTVISLDPFYLFLKLVY